MKSLQQIHRLAALLLLFVLTLSTIPKPFFHSLLADHHDVNNACSHSVHDAPCVKTASINCHFNDLVVNLPYIQEAEPITQPEAVSFIRLQSPEVASPLATSWLSKDNRGPPLN